MFVFSWFRGLTTISPRRGAVAAAVLLLLAVVASGGALAQGRGQEPPTNSAATQPAMSAALVKTGLYVISGGGGNSLLRFSANGLILVDGQLPGQYAPFMAQVRSISRITDLPVRFLILTDHHPEHAGNNAEFLAKGVRIIAQENAGRNLAARLPAGGQVSPAITFDREHTVRLGGIEARLLHAGRAHTNGDTIVYFPNLKVVALGHLLAEPPEPDFKSGGSLIGWGAALGEVLKLDFDVAVPARGAPVGRADVERFKQKIETLTSRAAALVKSGVRKDQLMARLDTADLGWRFNVAGDDLDRFYAELSPAR